MAITSTMTTRIGQITLVIVTSGLTPPVYFHWYLDGAYMGMTGEGSFSLALKEDEQARVEVIDTTDPAFDPLAAPPAFFPARFTIHWVRSLATDAAEYRIEETNDGGAWTAVGRVPHDDEVWDYRFLSDRLVDLTLYGWRVVPVDRAGNDGTPLVIGAVEVYWNYLQTVVRSPDAPRWNFAWSPGTQRVTFAAA